MTLPALAYGMPAREDLLTQQARRVSSHPCQYAEVPSHAIATKDMLGSLGCPYRCGRLSGLRTSAHAHGVTCP